MQHGPAADSSSSTFPHDFYYRHTFFSKFVGGVSGAVFEQGVFHPVDTAAKTAMANKSKTLPWLRALVAREGMLGATKQLYGGFALATAKKGPMRLYKYGLQDEFNTELSKRYQKAAEALFGVYGNVVIQTAAGAATGAFEPVFFQAIDTLQVRKQVKQESISVENAKKLGLRNLYRATFVTGLGRNVPGSIGLFGGSELANHMMDNQDHKSDIKNLGAKTGGAFFSLILSQPGDVIKTDMQTKQISFLKAWEAITWRQLFSSGLVTRLALAGKVGFGFLVIEKGMNYSKELFGEKVETPRKSSRVEELSRILEEDDTSARDAVLSNSSAALLNSFNAHFSNESSPDSRLIEEPDEVAVLTKEFKKAKI